MNFSSKAYHFIVGALFLTTVLFHYVGILQPIENRLRTIFAPMLNDMHGLSITVGDSYQFFGDREAFFTAYNASVKKNENLAAAEAQLSQIKDENAELRKQLNYFQKHKIAHVLVNVIGKELFSTRQTIVVDGGKASGLVEGDPVVVGDGILIGKVGKVNENTAIVRLLNDNESRVGALLLNKEKSQGVIEGGFGISLQMNLIPRDETILVGDKVVTSGLELTVPRGLYIGTVAAIENEPYKPFQQAIISPGTNLDKLLVVSVLLTK